MTKNETKNIGYKYKNKTIHKNQRLETYDEPNYSEHNDRQDLKNWRGCKRVRYKRTDRQTRCP